MDQEVDILLATYDGEEFVGEQIETLLEQTNQRFNLIVGDDASRDSTPEIISDYARKNKSKILFNSYQDNVGTILNFSRIQEHSTAPYLMLSDQDDIWLPQKIEVSLNKIKELEVKYGKETPILVYTDVCVVDDNLHVLHPSFFKFGKFCQKNSTLPRVLAQNHITGCTMIMNRALAKLAFPIPKEAYMHDHWINLTATTFGIVEKIPLSTVYYRQHSQNWVGACTRVGFKQVTSLFSEECQAHHSTRLLLAKMIQAYSFYQRYHHSLNPEQKKLFEKFITLKNQPFLKEVNTRFQFGFQRGGFYRGVYDIIASYLRGPIPDEYKIKI